ncbi:tripartite tricarboxylate transporter substrate binding protein [Roseiarcaceae bacterium H3SJ34-1]|uniref:Bug family tripartite tricarboxylate transporter substrate binding protein n=1 Tax=Terripilifer ovatus TaxID=3032367 RepID=UPI003AB97F32|nr:tripartite tricarboxylate transporter substrate binding protein [Roseiarcaceae bacterium H3SJ34-1]
MRRFLAISFIWLASIIPAAAQTYPRGPIKVLCSFAAGSGADVIVRFFANKLAEQSKATVIVENRVGAQGNIGTAAVAHARPDGQTILITANTVLAAAPHLFKDLGWDPRKDFAPVGMLARLSFVFAVDAKSSMKSMDDLVQELQKSGEKGFYGSTVNTGIVAAELFKAQKNLSTQRIPFKDVSDALGGLLQGEVTYIIYDTPWVLGNARAGKIRPLALTSKFRSSSFADVPTMAELGYKDYDLTPWWGVVAPAGTPEAIVKQLTAWFAQITAAPDTKAFLNKIAADPYPGTPDDMKAQLESDFKAWGDYVRLANIPVQ